MFAGGMRGGNQRPGDSENEEGTRPVYLVEDEDTWMIALSAGLR